MIIFFILSIILIFLIDGMPLIKKKLWTELTTFSFLIGFAILFAIMSKLEIPNPINWMSYILEPIGKAVLKQF